MCIRNWPVAILARKISGQGLKVHMAKSYILSGGNIFLITFPPIEIMQMNILADYEFITE